MKLKGLFDITYGQADFTNKSNLEPGVVPIISAKSTTNGVHGFYDVVPKYKHVIACPRTGSICEATYQGEACCVDDNCLVLSPKDTQDVRFMFWVVLLIRREKWRYFYGRQVTPTRLGELEIPDPPAWIQTVELPTFPEVKKLPNEKVNITGLRLYTLRDLFDISIGNNLDLCNLEPGAISFVSRTSKNNGITSKVSIPQGVVPFTSGSITIALVGSILESFVQTEEFVTSQNIAVLYPKTEMTLEAKLWYCMCIKANAFRYSYGRNAHSTFKDIEVPEVPDWVEAIAQPYLDLVKE